MVPSRDRTKSPERNASNASDRARRRRVAAEREGESARILVCERDPGGSVQRLVKALHYASVVSDSLEHALQKITQTPVDVAVIAMEQRHEECVGLLQLLRRALPRTPFVLVLDDPTPAARLATLAVRPFYVAVPPVGHDEMASALRDAIAYGRKSRQPPA